MFVGCSEPEPEALPPEEIVSNAAARMNAMDGFYFAIDRSGAPQFLDPDETIAFRRAEGFYRAPDRAQATVRVIAPGLVTDVDIISIGDIQWQTNLLSAQWDELPPNWGFNPAVLFDADIGIQSILTSDLSALSLVGTETLDDGPEEALYLLSGVLGGGRMFELSNGLIGPESMDVQLWIAPETFELHRAIVTDPNGGAEGEASIWQIDFSRFEETMVIEPPG